jgi:hypothetical protein
VVDFIENLTIRSHLEQEDHGGRKRRERGGERTRVKMRKDIFIPRPTCMNLSSTGSALKIERRGGEEKPLGREKALLLLRPYSGS